MSLLSRNLKEKMDGDSFVSLGKLFIKIFSHYKKIGYKINVLQQTACLVVNRIMACNFAFLCNCMQMGQTSDSVTVPTLRLIYW